jgi:hypothetical protein
MKSRIEKIIEHGSKIKLEELNLNGQELSLEISNQIENLHLEFRTLKGEYEYSLRFEKRGIRFERYNHEEGDIESLQIVTDEKAVLGRKKGELVWRERFPNEQEGYDFFYVPFSDSKY